MTLGRLVVTTFVQFELLPEIVRYTEERDTWQIFGEEESIDQGLVGLTVAHKVHRFGDRYRSAGHH